MAYASLAEFKADMNKTTTGDDAVLVRLLDAATRNIDRYCNRPDGFVAVTTATARTYPGNNKSWLRIDECISVSGVRMKSSATSSYETLAATDYMTATGDERFPDYNGSPITAIRTDPNGDYTIWYRDGTYPTIEITARWGYASTAPHDIKTACIMQATRWYKRLQSAMTDSTATAEVGMLMYTQSLDPDIKRLLVDGRYKRPVI
jgi:hypothetical protein